MGKPFLTVVYPNSEGATFDHAYWNETHKALVNQYMAQGLSHMVFIKSVSAPDGSAAPALAIANLEYETLDDLNAAIAAAGPVIEDIPKYTNVTPHMIIGEAM